jgi:hypothetical protein
MIIEKYTSERNQRIEFYDQKGLAYSKEVKKGYSYYLFSTEEKAWCRHSGKLTKEEKQWVIKEESK